MTIPTQLVLRALLADPAKELYGVEIGTAAGLPSGTVHPILARLEGVGWLTSRWEELVGLRRCRVRQSRGKRAAES